MSDLGPMDDCPVGRKGHRIMAMWAQDEGVPTDFTLVCKRCGATRRIPVTGALYDMGSKDDLAGEEIAALFPGPEWEIR